MPRLPASLSRTFWWCAFTSFIGTCASAAESLSYNRDIRPILSDNCFACHGPDKTKQKGGLRLDVREAATKPLKSGFTAIVAGKAGESEMLLRILSTDPDEQMPPADSGHKLTTAQKEALRRWVAEGAAYERHWAFEPIRKTPATGNAIDFFVHRQLAKVALKPSAAAAPETQLRRVSIDLTGLPPTREETSAFLADTNKRGLDVAYEAAVDRLLRSPRYGERMAWQWLEAARYADTDGYQNDGPREMWRWRDWVIDAFNRNMPFDQFTIEQLAGDLLPNPTHEQLIATAFNRNNRYNSEEGIPIDEFLLENAVDRVDTTSTVWMGMTTGCARCHDHKYDPISQKEYYQLVDYFNDVAESGRATRPGNSEPWIKTPTPPQRAKPRSRRK
jgi:mono/diheme cytochrome c family protein